MCAGLRCTHAPPNVPRAGVCRLWRAGTRLCVGCGCVVCWRAVARAGMCWCVLCALCDVGRTTSAERWRAVHAAVSVCSVRTRVLRKPALVCVRALVFQRCVSARVFFFQCDVDIILYGVGIWQYQRPVYYILCQPFFWFSRGSLYVLFRPCGRRIVCGLWWTTFLSNPFIIDNVDLVGRPGGWKFTNTLIRDGSRKVVWDFIKK